MDKEFIESHLSYLYDEYPFKVEVEAGVRTYLQKTIYTISFDTLIKFNDIKNHIIPFTQLIDDKFNLEIYFDKYANKRGNIIIGTKSCKVISYISDLDTVDFWINKIEFTIIN